MLDDRLLKNSKKQIIRGLCRLLTVVDIVEHDNFMPTENKIKNYLSDLADMIVEYLENETFQDWQDCIKHLVGKGWVGANYKRIPPIPEILKVLRGEEKYLEIAKKASKSFIEALKNYKLSKGAYFEDDIANRTLYKMGGFPVIIGNGNEKSDYEYSSLEKKFKELYQEIAQNPECYKSGYKFSTSNFIECSYLDQIKELSLPTNKKGFLGESNKKLKQLEAPKKDKDKENIFDCDEAKDFFISIGEKWKLKDI